MILLPSYDIKVSAQESVFLDFEKRLQLLWQDQLPLGNEMGALIERTVQRVSEADINFDDKFELKYFLTQLSYIDDLNEMPALSDALLTQIPNFLPKDTFDLLLKRWALHNFKRVNSNLIEDYKAGEINKKQLNYQHQLLEEIPLYDIHPGFKVADLGAGDGNFGILLHLFYPDIQLFLNEITINQTRQIENQLLILPSDERQTLQVIYGLEYSSQLEGQNMDVIILRNVFHHFRQPATMLASIRQSLKAGGSLYLLEQFKGDIGANYQFCAFLKPRHEIEQLLEKAGWELVRTIVLERQSKYLLEYK